MKSKIHDKEPGFTLIELMITVAILAILTAIALPSYRQYVQRGDRAQAMATLLQNANWMQQQFTINNGYPAAISITLTPTFPAFQSPPSGTAKYTISLAAGNTSTAYTLQAVPATADKCGTFTLDNTGLRSIAVPQTSPASNTTDCWAGR